MPAWRGAHSFTATRDDLRRLATWLTVETPELRSVIDHALDTVEAVAQAEFWTTAEAAAEVHEEVPFAARDAADGLPRVVSGTIDLVHRTVTGWRLLDYKTDVGAGGSDLEARYAAQVEAYTRAWAEVSGEVVESQIVPVRIGRGPAG
jgi:ATP-dependent exoDNAse (exonuclease V) beta subunit